MKNKILFTKIILLFYTMIGYGQQLQIEKLNLNMPPFNVSQNQIITSLELDNLANPLFAFSQSFEPVPPKKGHNKWGLLKKNGNSYSPFLLPFEYNFDLPGKPNIDENGNILLLSPIRYFTGYYVLNNNNTWQSFFGHYQADIDFFKTKYPNINIAQQKYLANTPTISFDRNKYIGVSTYDLQNDISDTKSLVYLSSTNQEIVRNYFDISKKIVSGASGTIFPEPDQVVKDFDSNIWAVYAGPFSTYIGKVSETKIELIDLGKNFDSSVEIVPSPKGGIWAIAGQYGDIYFGNEKGMSKIGSVSDGYFDGHFFQTDENGNLWYIKEVPVLYGPIPYSVVKIDIKGVKTVYDLINLENKILGFKISKPVSTFWALFSGNILYKASLAIPSIPTTTSNSRCGSGEVNLNASGCLGTYNWYTSTSGGSSLGMEANFTTPTISISTPYYVDCTVGNYTSARAYALATINTIPSAPSVNSVTITSGQTATLTANNCNNGTVKWYNQQTGGMLLYTLNPYKTDALTTNTTFYASCTINNCESTTRGSGVVTVNPVSNPCSPTITHATGVLPAGTYHAGQTIDSKANISSPTTFKAGKSILFTNGFSAGPNETFLAKIEGCNTNTIPTNGLVAYFSLDGNANDTGGNMGTVSGATLTTDRKGVANKAYSFDGNDKITAIDNNLPTGNTPRTFSIWVYSSGQQSNTTPATLLSYGTPSMSFQHCSFVMWGNKLRLSNWSGPPDIDYTYSHPVNQWFHLVIKLDEGNVVKIYVNGALQHTSSVMETWNTVKNGQLIFGENLVQGKLDEIRIYNRAITDTEVLQIYNAEKP